MKINQPQIIDSIPSLALPLEEDIEMLDNKLALERAWFNDALRYRSIGDIALAIEKGMLVELNNTHLTQRIKRFESNIEGYIPYLTPQAVQAVLDLADLWVELLPDNQNNKKEHIKMSITSMVRTQEYQDKIASNPKKLAVFDSTHCTGNAFDVDVSAYYRVAEDGSHYSISDPRRHDGQRAISQVIANRYNGGDLAVLGEGYSNIVTDSLIKAAREMSQVGAINLVEEFTGTENACLHIAVNPDY